MLIGNRFGTRSAPVQAPVVVYGTRWCAASQMVRRYLDRKGIPYRFVDLEQDPLAAAQVRWVAGGTVSHPTVSVAGEILVQPSLDELGWALDRAGLEQPCSIHQFVSELEERPATLHTAVPQP